MHCGETLSDFSLHDSAFEVFSLYLGHDTGTKHVSLLLIWTLHTLHNIHSKFNRLKALVIAKKNFFYVHNLQLVIPRNTEGTLKSPVPEWPMDSPLSWKQNTAEATGQAKLSSRETLAYRTEKATSASYILAQKRTSACKSSVRDMLGWNGVQGHWHIRGLMYERADYKTNSVNIGIVTRIGFLWHSFIFIIKN